MGCVSAKPSPSVIGPVAVPVASRKRRVLGAPPDDIVQRIRQKFAGTLGCGLERGFGWNVLGYEMAEPLQCPDGMSVWVVCIGLCAPVVQDRHVRRLHTCYQSYAEPAGDLSVLSLRSIFNQIPYGDLAANSGREHGQPMPHSEPIIQRLLALAGLFPCPPCILGFFPRSRANSSGVFSFAAMLLRRSWSKPRFELYAIR